MNLNKLAIEICKREGGKVETNIAQVKEVMRVLVEILRENLGAKETIYLQAGNNSAIYVLAEIAPKPKKKGKKK